MEFKTEAESFNFYRTMSIEDMEKRADEIGKLIDTDENANLDSLNIELRGIKEAKENRRDKIMNNNPNAESMYFSNMNQKQEITIDNVLESQEYRSAFLKNILGREMNQEEREAFNLGLKASEKRADAFTSSSNATAVIPTNTLNEVVAKARLEGGLLAECRAFNVPSNISIPVGTPLDKAVWHTEGQSVDGVNTIPTNVSFNGYEIIKVLSISLKAKTMSIPAFESYLVDELNACVMECIADALVNGTGTGQGKGLLTGITWNDSNKIADGEATYSTFTKAMGLLKRGYSKGAKWAMNNATLYNQVYSITTTTGKLIMIEDPKTDSIGKILGHEVIVDDNIPDNIIILGDFKKYMGYNMPAGIAVEVSRESSFRKGLIDYRAMAIADCKPIVPEAFIKVDVTPIEEEEPQS